MKFRPTNCRDLLLIALLFLALAPAAHAACLNPTGNAGDIVYNGDYHVPEYCNGVNWVAMAPQINAPPTNGLVGWWKLDDGSGTSAVDSSGNNNTGTLVNSPAWTTGYYDGALTFNGGLNQYVTVPDVASLRLSGSWTVASWVNLSGLPSGGNRIKLMERQDSSGYVNYGLALDNNADCGGIAWHALFNDTSGAGYNVCYITTINMGVWYHAAAVWDSSASSLMLYLNGALVGTQNFAGHTPTVNAGSNLTFATGHSSEYLKGTMDDARLYNRALSAAEISTLYNWHTYPATTGLVGYWKFDESSGTAAADSSGNGNTGALVNGPAFTSAGKLAGAITLNGSNQYVSVPNASSLNLNHFTLASWINFATSPAGQNIFIAEKDNGSDYNYTFYYASSNFLYCAFGGSGGGGFVVGPAWSPSTNHWYHVACTYDGANVQLYVDGQQVASRPSTDTPLTTSNPLNIGYTPLFGGTGYFNGTLDDVRLYNRALSADEIYGIYRTSSPVCSGPSGYEGDVAYNAGTHHVMQFCDNAGWRPLGPVPGTGGGGCSSPAGAEGNMIYNDTALGSGWMQYCDGAKWVQIGGPNIPTSGLVGYWKFDDGSGGTAADSSGGGNIGTLQNSPAWTTGGHDAGALTFNGSNTDVYIPGTFGGPAAVTLAAWAKLTGDTANGSELVSLGDCLGIRLDSGGANNNTIGFYRVTAMWEIYNSNLAYAGTGWHHFAFVANPGASSEALYVDGMQVASGTDNTAIQYGSGCFGNTYIGIHGNPDGLFPFNGTIDEVRVYNRALSASEIWQLYNGT